MAYIAPDQYAETSAYDLLVSAAKGFIGFDQRLIHALVDRPDRTLPDIVRFAARETVGDDLVYDLVAIFHYLNTPDAVPFYMEAIRENVEEISDELTEAVVALGQPMLEPLLALYHEVGEEQGGEIAFVLAGLGIRDQRIYDLLVERLEYEAGDGALSLSLYGDPAAIPHIQRILDEVPDEDGYLRHELQSAISQLESEPSSVQPAPLEIFQLYPAEADPIFEILSPADRLSLLTGTPPEIRAGAAASFRNEDFSRDARNRIYQVARDDPDANVRGRAWEALDGYAEEPDIHAALLAAASGAPLEERTGAVVALASSSELDPQTIPLIESLYNEPAARAKAVEAMWKSLDQRFRPYVIEHLDDPDPLVRHHAIYGVGYLGIGSEAARLVPLFEDDEFRDDALLAYALSVPAEIGRARMKPLFRRIEQLADGFSRAEAALVEQALDQRLMLRGLKPVFEAPAEPEPEPQPKPAAKVGRNDPCPCGSGKKYKKCHGR